MEAPPPLPLITRVSFFLSGKLMDIAFRSDGTVNRKLIQLSQSFLLSPADANPRNFVTTHDITVDAAKNVWFRLFVPTNHEIERLPVLIFFHGGGFVYLSPDFKFYDLVCRRFASSFPAVVVSVNYRFAPECPYPAQYDDGFDVLKFLDERDGILPENADFSNCFVAGDSAGGNIAHHLVKRFCESSGFSRVQIRGLVAIQPFFGGEERAQSEIDLDGIDPLLSTKKTDFMWRAFMPDDDRDHEVINVSGPRAADISKLENFPATAVVIGGFDSLKDWQRKYYEWLRDSGKEVQLLEYPNMFHAFYVFPELNESHELITEIKSFIGQRVSKG